MAGLGAGMRPRSFWAVLVGRRKKQRQPRITTDRIQVGRPTSKPPSFKMQENGGSWWLFDPQFLAGLGAETFRGPLRKPHDLDIGVGDSRDAKQAALYVFGDLTRRGTTLGGERHFDFHIFARGVGDFGGLDANFVDQTEVNDVDRDLRVVTFLERCVNFFLGYGHSILFS